jgi:uncharacterized protein (DUF433 family)
MNDDQLIRKHIDPNPDKPEDAWIKGSGAAVWAIISYLEVVGGDIERTARDYHVSADAVRAALAYYNRHRALIEPRVKAVFA